MLYTYSITDQTVLTDGILSFNVNGVLTGCTVSHTAGTGAINLNRAGYYLVHFNGSFSAASTEGDVVVQLLANGIAVDGATAAATDQTEGNLAFTTIVRVLPNCCAVQDNVPTTLTFENQGAGVTFINTAATVTKLC